MRLEGICVILQVLCVHLGWFRGIVVGIWWDFEWNWEEFYSILGILLWEFMWVHTDVGIFWMYFLSMRRYFGRNLGYFDGILLCLGECWGIWRYFRTFWCGFSWIWWNLCWFLCYFDGILRTFWLFSWDFGTIQMEFWAIWMEFPRILWTVAPRDAYLACTIAAAPLIFHLTSYLQQKMNKAAIRKWSKLCSSQIELGLSEGVPPFCWNWRAANPCSGPCSTPLKSPASHPGWG